GCCGDACGEVPPHLKTNVFGEKNPFLHVTFRSAMVDSCAGGFGGDAAFSLKYFKVDQTTDGEPPKFVGAPKNVRYLRLPAADGNIGAEYDETVKDDCGDDAIV
ncbi:unnamed protein product, partial [Amoebophrya sp. A25]